MSIIYFTENPTTRNTESLLRDTVTEASAQLDGECNTSEREMFQDFHGAVGVLEVCGERVPRSGEAFLTQCRGVCSAGAMRLFTCCWSY